MNQTIGISIKKNEVLIPSEDLSHCTYPPVGGGESHWHSSHVSFL